MHPKLSPEAVQKAFYLSQIILPVIFIVIAWIFFRPKAEKSRFKVRESDLKRAKSGPGVQKPDAPPLALPGISLGGAPHEILGVAPDATATQINRAYRELMKRYHPDKVARAGTTAWSEAQKIAEALNTARDTLLRKSAR